MYIIIKTNCETVINALGPFKSKDSVEKWLNSIGAIQSDHHQVPDTVWFESDSNIGYEVMEITKVQDIG